MEDRYFVLIMHPSIQFLPLANCGGRIGMDTLLACYLLQLIDEDPGQESDV